MTKEISPTVQQLINQRQATEPMTVISVAWPDGLQYYADTDLVIGQITCHGLITEQGSMSSISQSESVSDFSSISIGLLDKDSLIKEKLNSHVLDGISCTVYNYYRGTEQSDMSVILSGKMDSATWDEGTRVFSFNIESQFEAELVGHKVDAYEFPGFNNEQIGQVWPMVFGTCIEVPALKVRAESQTALRVLSNFTESDAKISVEPHLVNGLPVPQLDATETFDIAGFRMTGIFRKEVDNGVARYYIEPVEMNLPRESGIAILERPEDDPASEDKSVVFVDPKYQLAHSWVLIGGMYNYCRYQVGQKCYFYLPWPSLVSPEPSGPWWNSVRECAVIPRQEWSSAIGVFANSNTNYVSAANNSTNVYRARNHLYVYEFTGSEKVQVIPGRFLIKVGAPGLLRSEAHCDTYVCNAVPSVEILDVWAWRTYHGQKQYVQVPSSYYTKHLSLDLGGTQCTAIVFDKPLTDRSDEEWEDEIFVSLRSSINHEVTSQISYLVENYSPFSIDAASCADVRQKTKDFWMCFVLTEETEVLQLISEMAWQARCALLNTEGIIKFIFLPDKPATACTLNPSWVASNSLKLSTTSLDDVATQITALWRRKPAEDDDDTDGVLRYIYENNVDVFGSKPKEITIDKYNMHYCVDACIQFWGSRMSNIWRQLQLTTFLNAVNVEVFDSMRSKIPAISSNTLDGILTSVEREDDTISLKCEMASRPTDVDINGQPMAGAGYWMDNPQLPAIVDPGSGRSEIDYTVPVWHDPVITDAPAHAQDSLVFQTHPTEVVRGRAFSMSAQIVDANGALQNTNRNGFIELTSTDTSDAISTMKVAFQNGQWTDNGLTITGGEGEDTGSIRFVVNRVKTISAPGFTIREEPQFAYDWIVPAEVTRGEKFSVTLTGPPSGEVEVSLVSANSSDVLYQGVTSITSVTLDTEGKYVADDWVIDGGDLAATAQLQAHDPEGVLDDGSSDMFTIQPSQILEAQSSVRLLSAIGEARVADGPHLWITSNMDPVEDGQTFDLRLEYRDSDGEIIIHNGPVLISLKGYNMVNNVLTEVGPLVGSDFGPHATQGANNSLYSLLLSEGVWEYDQCAMAFTFEGDLVHSIKILASATIDNMLEEVELVREVKASTGTGGSDPLGFLVLSSSKSPFEIGEPFPLRLEHLKKDGSLNTSFDGPATIQLAPASTIPMGLTNFGLKGTVSGTTATVSLVGGVWEYSNCEAVWPATDWVQVSADLNTGKNVLEATLDRSVTEAPLVSKRFSIAVDEVITFGTTYPIVFRALDEDGLVISQYVPAGDIQVQYSDPDGHFTSTAPNIIRVGDWVNGEASLSMQINSDYAYTYKSRIFIENMSNTSDPDYMSGQIELVFPKVKEDYDLLSSAEAWTYQSQYAPALDDPTCESVWHKIADQAVDGYRAATYNGASLPKAEMALWYRKTGNLEISGWRGSPKLTVRNPFGAAVEMLAVLVKVSVYDSIESLGWYDYINNLEVRAMFTTNGDSFATGGDAESGTKAMVSQAWDYGYFLQQSRIAEAAGKSDFDIALSTQVVSWINDHSGDDFSMVMHLEIAGVPFRPTVLNQQLRSGPQAKITPINLIGVRNPPPAEEYLPMDATWTAFGSYGAVPSPHIDDTDAAADTWWKNVQNHAFTEFSKDTFSIASELGHAGASFQVGDVYSYIAMSSRCSSTKGRYRLTAENREAASDFAVKMDYTASDDAGPVPDGTFKILFCTGQDTIRTGHNVLTGAGAAVSQEWSIRQLELLKVAQGTELVTLALSNEVKAWLKGLSTEEFYVVGRVVPDVRDYKASYYSGGGGFFPVGVEYTFAASLVLYK